MAKKKPKAADFNMSEAIRAILTKNPEISCKEASAAVRQIKFDLDDDRGVAMDSMRPDTQEVMASLMTKPTCPSTAETR